MKPHLVAGAKTLSYNHEQSLNMHPQADELCLQVSWNGMAPSQSNCFLRFVGSNQILSFKFPSLSLPSKSTKLFTWGCFINWFQNSHFQHLINFLLDSFFQVNWNRSTRVCLGVTFGSNWMWYGEPGKHPIPTNTSG